MDLFKVGELIPFVQLMNQKAAELGMENTNFAGWAGLDNEGHYSTARDIALMSRALLRYPKITDYTTIWMDTLRNGATSLVNTNELSRCAPVTGTGQTAHDFNFPIHYRRSQNRDGINRVLDRLISIWILVISL